MSADVGLGGRDGQGRGQRVRVEGGLQHHQGPVHSALVEVVRKLLLRETREMTPEETDSIGSEMKMVMLVIVITGTPCTPLS